VGNGGKGGNFTYSLISACHNFPLFHHLMFLGTFLYFWSKNEVLGISQQKTEKNKKKTEKKQNENSMKSHRKKFIGSRS
jgi:hypothetical protein